MQKTVTVANVMCGGCAGTIESNLSAMEGVAQVSVNVEAKSVTLDLDEACMPQVAAKLTELGYPIQE